jgi:hypothetical protein
MKKNFVRETNQKKKKFVREWKNSAELELRLATQVVREW